MIKSDIISKIIAAGGEPYYVGGCVRDVFMNKVSKDIDIEVFLIDQEKLISVLSENGKVDLFGKSFGIIKYIDNVTKENIEFSLPRKEKKTGEGYTGFSVEIDPFLPLGIAASRRDFTINSIMIRCRDNKVIDRFDGIRHIKEGILHPTSEAFIEDPLRVLRGFQFAGRFNMRPSEQCVLMCCGLKREADSLSKDRVWVEWEKFLTKSDFVYKGISFLEKVGWLHLFYLENKYGDVAFRQNPQYRLCQILDKCSNRQKFLKSIGCPNKTSAFVTETLLGKEIWELNPFEDLEKTVMYIASVLKVSNCYHVDCAFNLRSLNDIAASLRCCLEKAPAIINSEDVARLGIKPGKKMGDVLRDMYRRQLEKEFTTKEYGLILMEKYHGENK